MQSTRPSAGNEARAKSFSRLEPAADSPLNRSRASTTSKSAADDLFPESYALSPESEEKAARADIFTTIDDGDNADGSPKDDSSPTTKLPETFEDLPIEIRSLTERFLDSLSAKVHPTPLTIGQLSQLFQDFYIRASSHISTHIATLSSRISRDRTSSSTARSRSGSKPSSVVSRKGSSTELVGGEQQMLTASEIHLRKKARKLLELKRVALEEAVERAVCEKIYDKIYRHKSTDDEERDQKLRSKTAALSLVGIGLKELLVSKDEITSDKDGSIIDKEKSIRESLSGARSHLQMMDQEAFPLGKLQHLTAAHKSIVETLSQIFPASSSADEILPTLIYTLITIPPEDLNVISNLNFIQRFRSSSKIDGEIGYCLVNLEAAVSFLETVDLSALRSDELPEGPRKNSSSHSPSRKPESTLAKSANATAQVSATSEVTPISVGASDVTSSSGVKQPPSPSTRTQRRLSHLIQVQTNRFEAASDAVRDSLRDGADQAIESINNTLDNSFKFLFGRLKEQQVKSPETVVPRTLEEALRLVGTQSPTEDDASATSSVHEREDDSPNGPNNQSNDRLTDLLGGKKPLRDRSVDSNQSGGSGRRGRVGSKPETTTPIPTPSSIVGNVSNVTVESMRNLGNTLNPLNRFANIGMIQRFGRANTSSPTPQASTSTEKPRQSANSPEINTMQPDAVIDLKAATTLDELRKTAPPVRRFLEMKDAREMKVGEVEELLKDYQRLAAILSKAIVN